MTGYGYKAREVDKTTVDWAGITKKISDDLISEENRREKLKLELEETHLEELKKIEDYPQGLDKEANVWAQERAQEAKRMLLERHKLMKSGLVSVNDSKLYRTRVNNTWDNLTSALNTYNENFKRISEAKGKGNEAIAMEMGEFANIDKRTIQYDSQGNGFYADIDPETGKIIEGSIKPVKAFNNIQAQEFAYVDVNQVTTDLSKDVPAWKNAITSTRDISSARLNPAYKDWLENTTTSQLNTDDKIASVLMDYLGLDYDRDGSKGTKSVSYEKITGYDSNGKPITETVTKEMGHVKMVYKDGQLVPELTEDQKEYAREAFKNAIEAKLISETDQQYVAPQRETAAEVSARLGKEEKEETYSLILRASAGDLEALQAIVSKPAFGVLNFEKDEKGGYTLKRAGKEGGAINLAVTGEDARGRAIGLASTLGLSEEGMNKFIEENGIPRGTFGNFDANIDKLRFNKVESAPVKEFTMIDPISSAKGAKSTRDILTDIFNKNLGQGTTDFQEEDEAAAKMSALIKGFADKNNLDSSLINVTNKGDEIIINSKGKTFSMDSDNLSVAEMEDKFIKAIDFLKTGVEPEEEKEEENPVDTSGYSEPK